VACQQVLPVQTTAADAFIAEKARTPAPRAAPNNVLVNDVFYSVSALVDNDDPAYPGHGYQSPMLPKVQIIDARSEVARDSNFRIFFRLKPGLARYAVEVCF
jgi:hypothetical protein